MPRRLPPRKDPIERIKRVIVNCKGCAKRRAALKRFVARLKG